MRWLPRLLGLGIVLGLIAWSISYSLDTLDNTTAAHDGSRDETTTDDDPGDGSILAASEDGSVPEYLAFSGGIPSGRYNVADLPGSRDWDYGERRGRTPEPSHISADNPVAEEITVTESQYVSGPENDGSQPAEDDSDQDADDESDESDNDSDSDSDSEAEPTDRDGLPSIVPGLYATRFGVDDCEYELRRIMDDNRDHVIGHDRVENGRMLVSINEVEPDSFVATESCGQWSPWSPLVDPLTTAGSGDYWIGDLATGIWTVPPECYWEKVVSFRGALLLDVESAGTGPGELTVDQFTLGLRVRHCSRQPMVWSSDLPPGPPIVDLEAAQEEAHRRPVYSDPEIYGSRSRRRRR